MVNDRHATFAEHLHERGARKTRELGPFSGADAMLADPVHDPT
ncbi:hypothetical protein WMF28_15640 [Sorangium sp. So ce590]